jgi:hypothetical protein
VFEGFMWSLVAKCRYNNIFNAQTAKPWAHEEDIRLAFAVRAYSRLQLNDTPTTQTADGEEKEGEEGRGGASGSVRRSSKDLTRWTDIAVHVPGRTEVHCRYEGGPWALCMHAWSERTFASVFSTFVHTRRSASNDVYGAGLFVHVTLQGTLASGPGPRPQPRRMDPGRAAEA